MRLKKAVKECRKGTSARKARWSCKESRREIAWQEKQARQGMVIWTARWEDCDAVWKQKSRCRIDSYRCQIAEKKGQAARLH